MTKKTDALAEAERLKKEIDEEEEKKKKKKEKEKRWREWELTPLM